MAFRRAINCDLDHKSMGGSRGGYKTALGVVTSHRGLGTSAQAEVALFVPSSIKTRVLGERVNVACQGISLEGQVFTEGGNILSIQDIRDWVGIASGRTTFQSGCSVTAGGHRVRYTNPVTGRTLRRHSCQRSRSSDRTFRP